MSTDNPTVEAQAPSPESQAGGPEPKARCPRLADWAPFPGEELEGKRPKVRCPTCRSRGRTAGTVCFLCYRAQLDRAKALNAAATLNTASEARFQWTLPFDPVDRRRLAILKVQRAASRRVAGSVEERRVRAQIAARHALFGNRPGLAAAATISRMSSGERMVFDHSAELQFPESWLPFVVSR